uniref:C-type lectin domain-containing protein n=1 Tax=Phasianus colchicus TaxID=9054 RepID=A0A669QZE0_PHACC
MAVHPKPTCAAGEPSLPLTCPPLSFSALRHPSCSPRPHFSHVCPNAWLSFQGKCFYFSDNESDWNSSREHCQRLGAALATVDTEEEVVR